jgi:hypothetical protein
MPLFNGVNIFGRSVRMRTQTRPRAVQENAFNGVNGVEMIDMGRRGRVTVVEGVLVGSLWGDLVSAVQLFRSYDDGRSYLLIDQDGLSWPNVRLQEFAPDEQSHIASYYYARPYRAVFLHQS